MAQQPGGGPMRGNRGGRGGDRGGGRRGGRPAERRGGGGRARGGGGGMPEPPPQHRARPGGRPRDESMYEDEVDNEEMDVEEPKHRIPRIGYVRLREWADLAPEELLNIISTERSGFPHALEDQPLMRKPDFMAAILAVINIALKSTNNPNATIFLLNKIRTSTFLNQCLADYVTAMQTESSPPKLRGFRKPIKDTLCLFKALMTSFPGNILVLMKQIVVVEYVIRALRQSTTVIDEETEICLDEMCAQREELIVKEKERKTAEAAAKERGCDNSDAQGAHEAQQPPDNFREMTIFPDVQQDIMTRHKPFLRPAVIQGGYENVDHYLDIQFRLLREDFVQPLRQGIKEYLDLQKETGRRVRLADIRVYHDVSVLTPICTHSGIQYKIRFDVARMNQVNWRYSKRLIYGSLLCLSKDEFNTIYIATVADRKPEMLQEGYLQVRFEVDPDEVRRIQPDERFLMVETSAYFEAYRHVLKALQTMEEVDIPFRENIIKCVATINRPRYLLTAAEPTYNIQPLIDGHRATVYRRRDSDDDDDSDEDYRVAPFSDLEILQIHRWPAAETLHLDNSQLRAVQAALTRELTIIQGPPGTGKTHIGLKIVEALHVNRRVWNPRGTDNSPILVVCFTNHALDQFLEGISRFLKSGIVRVGGRSKNEKMKGFLLSELRRKVREMRSVPRAIFHARMDIRQEMEKWQVEIEKTAALIDGTERGLIHEKILEDFMSDDHFVALTERVHLGQGELGGVFSNKSSGLGPSYLPDWLGLGEMMYVEEEPAAAAAEANADGAGEVPGEEPAAAEAPAERIEIEDDVAAIEAERLLELEDDELAIRRHQEEARRRRNLEQANQRLAVDFDNLPEVEGEWQVQRVNKKKRRERMQRGLRSTDVMGEEDARRLRNIWALNLDDRWRLYRYWVGQYKKDLKENVLECETQFQIAADRLREILEDEDRAIMQTMNVVGMTTTGAARYKNTLRQISPKIVIVEEAAEVLEAHVITTLSSGCEHLVLIGDHKQLRPSANVYKLSEEYGLKYSLFERLVMNQLPFETLENQHRMRPEIAELVRIIYPTLKDHDTVKAYEDIRGVETNLFLINHDEEEVKDEELKSVSNFHEASFVVALCRYLLLQGYHASQVTILTPYTGQMFLFKRLMPKEQFEGVRVCPIDNYQGEENDIVILSLVRSNTTGIGFVKDDNRACVAMSRAKKGLFVIGNFDLIGKHSTLWSKITQKARMMGNFGNELTLCCQNHPQEARIVVRCGKDFDQVPEGGCLRPCAFRLDCGHACERACHSYDRDHKQFRCMKPCRKVVCDNNHVCRKRCQEPCGECRQTVQKVIPNCGHLQNVPCGVSPLEFKCLGDCKHLLRCGHLCKMKCGEEHTKKCLVQVKKALTCGHSVSIRCYQQNDSIHCTQPCNNLLDCHHPCPGQCGSCQQGRLHVPCKFDCGRTLVCGHQCSEPCTRNCPPCSKRCENRCIHSRCPRECGRACEPCREQCQWRCRHHRCTKLCHEPCDRPRCDARCTSRLVCGHQCIGVCGEPCPKKCRVCHREEVTEIFFGNEDDDDARFVQLEDCGHVFEVDGLDHWMDMATTDANPANDIQMKRCPRCNTTIRRNLRYGTIINALLGDIERVKALILGDRKRNAAKQRELAMRLRRMEDTTEDETKFYRDRLSGPDLATDEVSCIENVINFLTHIAEWKAKVDAAIRESTDAQVRVKLNSLKSDMDPLRSWLLRQRVRFCEQELREAAFELTRLCLLLKFVQMEFRLNTCTNPRVTEEARRAFLRSLKQLRSGEPLTNAIEAEAKRAANELQPMLGGLAISDEERVQIIAAMDMGQGHWFKCPNDHIYAITECGGAMEESRCPECGAGIGGRNHALRGDNRLAPEMDGARAPAFNPNRLMNAEQLRQFQF